MQCYVPVFIFLNFAVSVHGVLTYYKKEKERVCIRYVCDEVGSSGGSGQIHKRFEIVISFRKKAEIFIWVAVNEKMSIGTIHGTMASREELLPDERRYAARSRDLPRRRQRACDHRAHLFGCIGDDARNGHSMGTNKRGATDTLRRPESSKKENGQKVGVTGVTSVTKIFIVCDVKFEPARRNNLLCCVIWK